ncbi:hypothetical protein [Lysobacter sp. A3-1-A15]|uniref:hypothetical protein n=1 Tax=Novilysobacter viscosus TaxID=3098602 RepID=UPI002EDA8B5A
MTDTPAFDIEFSPHPAGLRARVTGEGTLAATRGYWQAIVARLQAQPARGLLLVDEMHGPALSASQWQELVADMEGQGLERVRIAHAKPRGLGAVEHCEIHAREAGFEARVFADEATADLWLRYGAT